jgi:MOSC domain-containing protein YiiM
VADHDGELAARVASVNVGRPRQVSWEGRRVRTAIWKEPVDGPVEVAGVNLAGDDQADRRVHGGVDKAVYAYAAEDLAWWGRRLGRELGPGAFGENLTTEGLDLREAWVGERWAAGSVLFEVSEPRTPCFKLGIRMGDSAFVDEFEAAGRPGTYLRIVEPGLVAAGDEIRRVSRPAVRLTVVELAATRHAHDVDLLGRVAEHPAVPSPWRERARRALRRA